MKSSFALRLLIDVVGRGVTVLLVAVIARVLGVSEFGKVAFGFSVVNVLYNLTDGGTSFLFIREMGRATAGASSIHAATREKAAELRAIWKDFLGLRLGLLAVTLVVGSLAAPFIWKWEQPFTLVGLILWMLGNSLVEFMTAAGNAVQRIGVTGWVTLAHRSGVLLAVAVPLLLRQGLLPVALCMGGGSLLGAAASLIIVCRAFDLPLHATWRWRVWIDWVKTTLPLAGANICSGLYPRMGMLILPLFVTAEAAGYYGAAQRLFEVGYMVAGAFITVTLPHLSKTRAEDQQAFHRELRKATALLGGLALAWLVSGVVFARFGLRLLFGPQYTPATSTLRLLFIAGGLSFLNYYGASLMILFHRLKRHSLNEAAAVAVSGGLTCLLARFYGAHGAAAALIATEVCVFALAATALRDVWRRPVPGRPA